MKHNIKFSRLARDTSHRKALIKNLAKSLLQYKSITTTKAKAFCVKIFVNKIINNLKNKNMQRAQISYLKKHLEAYNFSFIKQTLETISNIEKQNSGNYLKTINLFNKRTDSANLIKISIIGLSTIVQEKECSTE